jgi:hypothetical protein
MSSTRREPGQANAGELLRRALYPVLRAEQAAGTDERTLRNVVAASAEG